MPRVKLDAPTTTLYRTSVYLTATSELVRSFPRLHTSLSGPGQIRASKYGKNPELFAIVVESAVADWELLDPDLQSTRSEKLAVEQMVYRSCVYLTQQDRLARGFPRFYFNRNGAASVNTAWVNNSQNGNVRIMHSQARVTWQRM